MLADDIASYLETQGIGTVSSTIFAGTLPVTAASTADGSPNYGIGVKETGGLYSEHTMTAGPVGIGAPVARLERPRFQVMTRATSYALARAKIQDAFNVLDGAQDLTLNGVTYYWISAVQSPIDLGPNANLQAEWTCNFDVMKAVSTSSST